MRLVDLYLEGFHGTDEVVLQLEPLTILFGANSSGKTSLLEVIGHLLGAEVGRQHLRSTEDRGYDEGSVLAYLDPNEASNDARILRLVVAEYLAERASDLDVEAAKALDLLSTTDVRAQFAAAYAADHEADGWPAGDDLATVAAAAYEGLGITFRDDRCSLTSISPDSPQLSARLARLGRAKGLFLMPGEDGEEIDEDNDYALAARGQLFPNDLELLEASDAAEQLRPSVYWLDLETPLLNEHVRGAIEDLDARLLDTPHDWLGSLTPHWQHDGAESEFGIRPEDVDAFNDFWNLTEARSPTDPDEAEFCVAILRPSTHPSHRDPWLEPDEGGGNRVRRTLQLVADRIAQGANKLAPSFVREQGTIQIEVTDHGFWTTTAPDRVCVTFAERAGGAFHLDALGSGVARWVAASVRLACQELLSSQRTIRDNNDELVVDRGEATRIVFAAQRDPEAFRRLRLESPRQLGVILVDEPEAHLHPLAVRSVAAWLGTLTNRAAAVIVATHHPIFLDTRVVDARRVTVSRKSNGLVRVLRGADLKALDEIAGEVGISDGELFLMSRVLLFVEGEHDMVVLDEMFGPVLAAAGVTCIPFRGADNAPAIVRFELVWRLGIPVAALLDHTVPDHVRVGRPTKEEATLDEMVKRAERDHHHIEPFRLSKPDIVFYLDDDVCRQRASRFPGWDAVEKRRTHERTHESGEKFKNWVETRWDLRLWTSDVRALARQCQLKGQIHPELSELIKKICDYAATV